MNDNTKPTEAVQTPQPTINEGPVCSPMAGQGTPRTGYLRSLYSERDYLENNLKKVNDKIHLLEGNKFLQELVNTLLSY